jgi:flagellar hook protein FlgE
MGSAISIGTTGLAASSKQMEVIGNNLANANTLGYKSSSTYFASMLNQSLSSGGSMQVGSGVAVASIPTQFAQGSFENTGNATDLAIDGDGFFMVKDKEGAQYYTRAGAFHISEAGYLVDTNGYQVQGYNNTADNENVDTLASISLRNVQSTPNATATTSMGINLDETALAGEKFNVSQAVFDSKGMQHNLSTTYQKTEQAGTWGYTVKLDDTNVSTGQSADGVIFDKNGDIEAMYKGAAGAAAVVTAGTGAVSAQTLLKGGQIYKSTTTPIVLTAVGDGSGVWSITNWGAAVTADGYENMTISTQEANKIKIDLDGMGGTDLYFDITAAGTWRNGDRISFSLAKSDVTPEDQVLQFDPLANGATIGTFDTSTNKNKVNWTVVSDTAEKISGYASSSVVRSLSDDGYTSGVLKSLTIGTSGTISGFFTNGQTSDLGKVILASFPNSSGLKKVGNYFGATIESGEAIRNAPGSGGLGEVMSNSLEISNTDTAREFINMITAQRAYQSSARVITTADQMLSELMNIKR